MNNPPAVVDMDYSKLQPSGLRRRSIYARPVKLDPPFVPRAGEYVRHRGGSVGRVRKTYCRNGVDWRSYVEFFCPNHWYHHVSTEDLSPLSLLEVMGGCCRIGCRGEGGTFLMSFGPRHRPKGFRGGPGPNNLRDLADQKAENKRRQEREKAYCNLFPVGTPVSIRSYVGGLHPELVKTYGFVAATKPRGGRATPSGGSSSRCGDGKSWRPLTSWRRSACLR